MILRNPLVVGAWRAQVHWVDQAWRVFCYSRTPTLFSSGSITTWREAVRFFAEFFSFLFDNMSRYYLVFASLFATFKFYFISLIMDEYGLWQCYRLFALIYSYSALSLSQSKSNLVVILIKGSKQALVFSHKSKLSFIIETPWQLHLYSRNTLDLVRLQIIYTSPLLQKTIVYIIYHDISQHKLMKTYLTT